MFGEKPCIKGKAKKTKLKESNAEKERTRNLRKWNASIVYRPVQIVFSFCVIGITKETKDQRQTEEKWIFGKPVRSKANKLKRKKKLLDEKPSLRRFSDCF